MRKLELKDLETGATQQLFYLIEIVGRQHELLRRVTQARKPAILGSQLDQAQELTMRITKGILLTGLNEKFQEMLKVLKEVEEDD